MPPKANGQSIKDPNNFSGINKDKYVQLVREDAYRHPWQGDPVTVANGAADKYDSMSEEELAADYDRLLDANPREWQAKTIQENKNVPEWVYNTGNAAVLGDYLNEHKEAMTYEQQHILKENIRVSEKRAELQREADEKMRRGQDLYTDAEIISDDAPENGVGAVRLQGVVQKEFQNTGNGCWANFFQVLASSKGVDLTQNDIKNYRPDISRQEAEKTNALTHEAYNADHENSALEMGDSILSFLPNTMLKEIEIPPYGERIEQEGISKEQFIDSAVEEMRYTISHAIIDDRSPIGLLSGGHYLTITGINGDTIEFKNSLRGKNQRNEPNTTYTASLKDKVKEILGRPNNEEGVQLTWLSDIKLSKDGRTVFGVPSSYVEMTENGELTTQPMQIRTGSQNAGTMQINRLGMPVFRHGGKEDTLGEQKFRSLVQNNIIKTEKVYLPKKLNADYLRQQAEKRSLVEENDLRRIDNDTFGMERPPLHSLDDLNLPKARKQSSYKDDFNSDFAERFRNKMFADIDDELTEKANQKAVQQEQQQIRESRISALREGFASIRSGDHPELFSSDAMDSSKTELDSLSADELLRAKDSLNGVFGTGSEGYLIMDMQAELDRFWYRKTPDSQPVNLMEDVNDRLINSKRVDYLKLQKADLYLYVRAELLRQLGREDSELCYINDDVRLEKLSFKAKAEAKTEAKAEAKAEPVQGKAEQPKAGSPAERIAAIAACSNDESSRHYYTLQDARLKKVGPDEVISSMAGRSREEIDRLAQVFDYIFGKEHKIKNFSLHEETGGKKTSKSFDELYDEQYKGSKRSKEEKENFKKAVVLNALASMNSSKITLGNSSVEGLDKIVFGPGSDNELRSAAKEELMSEKHNFSGASLQGYNNVRLEYGVDKIRSTLSRMLADVEAADPKEGKSSESFKSMKEKLTSLNKLVNETWKKRIDEKKPITFEMMNEFTEKADALRKGIKGYLDHKAEQIAKDPSLRSDPNSPDQKRIRANINNLKALNEMSRSVERGVLMGISGKARRFFKQDMQARQARRRLIKKGQANEFAANAASTLDRAGHLSSSAFSRQHIFGRESLKQARNRIVSSVEKNYSAGQQSSFSRSAAVQNTVAKAQSDFTQRNKVLTNAELTKIQSRQINALNRMAPTLDTDQYDVDRYSYLLLANDKKSLLDKSSQNATLVPDNKKEGIELMDTVFGFRPGNAKKYLSGKAAGSSFETLKDIPQDFKAVYRGNEPGTDGARLSEKDFAALAFSGARTMEAYEAVKPGKDSGLSPEDSRILNADKYTLSPFSGEPALTEDWGKANLPRIQNGRRQASEAMKAYSEGKLAPLAKLIAFGIKDTVSSCAGSEDMQNFSAAGEMTKRLCNMLERDDKLKSEAMKYGLKPKDLEMADSIAALGMIDSRSRYGEQLMKTRPDLLSENARHAVMADIYIADLVSDEHANLERNVLQKDSRYKKAMKQAPDGKSGDMPEILAKKLGFKNPLFEKLGKPGAYEALRQQAVKMIKETEFRDMSIKDFEETMRSIRTVKADTNKSSTLHTLKEYSNGAKGKNGLYKLETGKPQPSREAGKQVKTGKAAVKQPAKK